MEKDQSFILVGKMQVGWVGLKGIFEELKNSMGTPEPELKAMLVEKVGRMNYIASSVRQEYEKALFREFRKFLGEKVEEEQGGTGAWLLFLQQIGGGCDGCAFRNRAPGGFESHLRSSLNGSIWDSFDSCTPHQRNSEICGNPAREVHDQEVAGGRKEMKIKHVVFNLRPEDTLRLTRILLDEDKDEALAFIKECLKPQLDEATRDH